MRKRGKGEGHSYKRDRRLRKWYDRDATKVAVKAAPKPYRTSKASLKDNQDYG